MAKQVVITDKKKAGQFTRQTIIANMKEFVKFDSPKGAYAYFQQHYPHVSITYDNFFYHLNEAKKTAGVAPKPFNAKRDMSDKTTKHVESLMPEAEFEMLPPASVEDVEIKLYNPKNEKVKEEIFNPYRSGKFIDNIISKKIGSMPGTTVVVTGGPSVGKTTVCLDTLHNVTQTYLKTINKKDHAAAKQEFVYFSSEMKKIDIQAMAHDSPWINELLTILLNEYPKNQYKALIEKVLTHGYRYVVLDSFQNMVERLVAFCGMTTTGAATFLLNLLEKANTGDTTTGHCTCILLIQQVTKGGVFVGKNGLKHDTTAMLELRFDENNQSRYMEFTKNRRNGAINFKKLYYSLNEKGELVYDENRWNEDRERETIMQTEREQLHTNRENFASAFLSGNAPDNDNDDDDEV